MGIASEGFGLDEIETSWEPAEEIKEDVPVLFPRFVDEKPDDPDRLHMTSEDADVSSDGESDSAWASTVASDEKETHAGRRVNGGHVTRDVEVRQGNGGCAAVEAREKITPNRSLKLDHLRLDEEEEAGHYAARSRPTQRTKTSRGENAPSSVATTPRESRQRPAPLEQVSQLEDTRDAPSRRTRRSPKMEVGHLVSGESTVKATNKAASSATAEEKMIERLEAELQKEKKRVLEKMTQLLDEQGKNQQAREQIEALEAQLAAKDREMSAKLQESACVREEQILTEDDKATRVTALEDQVRTQEAKIARLKHDKAQLKTAVKQLTTMSLDQTNDRGLGDNQAVTLQAQLDGMTRCLHEFLARVERWKTSSKERMQDCDEKTDLPALVEHVWLSFPAFSGITPVQPNGGLSPNSEQPQSPTNVVDEQADAVVFLKKRLRQREDELRQTHVKYVELKELCARQCVREADLQNFINEHRLRGNLIIGKNTNTNPNGVVDNQDQAHDDHQNEHRPSAKLKMISSRGTNTPAPFNERSEGDENFVNDEYSDNQDDNDDYEGQDEEEEYEYPVRTPKIFVQVGRDGVYEHASPTDSAVAQKLVSDRSHGKHKPQPKHQRVERIRLVPSPSLEQRYERVPAPTTTGPRRRKSAQQAVTPQSSSRSNPALLGECPPGCGSRLSFTRRKAPSVAARAKPVKRPVSTTSSKGAIGVIRPWM
ncbi:unnamed protein product [Phytophthora fragariaefolia]|uniref:Unnamed protein product n=1 Tax=Phytophthora fragariaefolia TaxID=1490495 RepID=A0A9W7CZS1_9STRA|nr:unnamed protein product [Phytophthora fragariaefolia]